MSVLIVHAPNVHQGGGRVLLLELLSALGARTDCKVVLDARLELPEPLPPGIGLVRVNPTVLDRLAAEWKLREMAGSGDTVLCFGNLPPLFGLKARQLVFLQNRYLVGNKVSLSGLPLPKRIQIVLERAWFRWRIHGIDRLIVQTPTMQRAVLTATGIAAAVLPFSKNLQGYGRRPERHRDRASPPDYDFLYVATGEPHKNHVQLVEAWKLLARDGIFPSLRLTLPATSSPGLSSWIEGETKRHALRIDNRAPDPSRDMAELYARAAALIYPSTMESLGLPLIEARVAGLPILAPELDYVRDLVDPEDTFDPDSPVSIARAVRRHLGRPEDPLAFLSPDAFVRAVQSDRPGRDSGPVG